MGGMSHFECNKCGVMQVDSGAAGYTAGCCHHPPEVDRIVVMDFGDGGMTKGFYRGSFYTSEKSYSQRRAVHPVKWRDIPVEPAEYRGAN